MNLKAKLSSRKFWAAVANFVSMLLVYFKFSEDQSTQVAALIMAGATVIAYIVGEGIVDVANADITYVEKVEGVEDDGTDA